MWLNILLCMIAFQNAVLAFEFGKEPEESPQQSPPNHLFFGDVQLNGRQKVALKHHYNMGGSSSSSNVFGADNRINRRWTNAVIPYEIDCSLENLDDAMDSIKKAMQEWKAKTCIRFVKRTNEKYFLQFFRNTHCWGNVGMTSYTKISVGHGCEFQHVMTHEIGHVVGFYHEQNRKDRDQYVKVHWENIGQFKDAFDIVQNTDSLGVPYDYESIMHYPWHAFSANGKKTMTPLKSLNGKTPYVALSALDAKQTSLMYDCPAVERKRKQARMKRHAGRIPMQDSNACVDENTSCDGWAKAGYCSTNDYVQQHCKKSCGAPSCQGGSGNSGSCSDQRSECRDWASMGYCKTSDTVRMACKKSCGSCTDNGDNGGNGGNGGGNGGSGNSGDCVDERKECPEWAGMGHCSLSETVKNACRKSCNPSCSKNEMCKDEDHDCGDWASAGHCVTNPTVKRLCPRSCDNCNGRPTYPPTQRPNPTVTVPTTPSVYRRYLGYGKLCIDDDSRCPYWKSIGECQRNPSWMNSHCMITCGVSKCDSGIQRPPGSCSNPLGLSYDGTGNFKIPDSAFSSRTDFHPGRGWVASAANARLYMPDNSTSKRIGSWCSNSYDDARTDFLQVDLGQMRTITYIATQGRYKYFERVSKFKIEYSTDGRSFTPYIQDGNQKVFDGNCDHVTPVLNQFKRSIRARYIKYIPVEYNFACVRMELYGC